MPLDLHGGTIQGARDYQEDYFEICVEAIERPDDCLIVLCDGMGGHSGGAIASKTAATIFINHFLQLTNMSVCDALREALEASHESIRHEISENEAPPDMGTTLVAVYASEADISWLSVGDSHLYHFHEGRLEKLNADHSMASVLDELADIGRISKEDAQSDPQRNALRSCLSADDISLVDIQHREGMLKSGDKLILATDGLDTLDLEVIEKIVTKNKRRTSEAVVASLLSKVESVGNPSQDNTTIVVLSEKKRSWFL
jgi:protein phosphatase